MARKSARKTVSVDLDPKTYHLLRREAKEPPAESMATLVRRLIHWHLQGGDSNGHTA